MSRSKKKNPIWWLCCQRERIMKDWKRQCNRKIRRIPLDVEIRHHKKITDPWLSPADGKVDASIFIGDKAYRK